MVGLATAKLLGAAALLTLIAVPSAGRAETVDELYAKAKAEQSLVIYAGGPVTNYEPLAREFETKFPASVFPSRAVSATR
ncbi:MAG: hypothetical protein ACJ8F2_12020 [Xanthobacteraceae bacterium]